MNLNSHDPWHAFNTTMALFPEFRTDLSSTTRVNAEWAWYYAVVKHGLPLPNDVATSFNQYMPDGVDLAQTGTIQYKVDLDKVNRLTDDEIVATIEACTGGQSNFLDFVSLHEVLMKLGLQLTHAALLYKRCFDIANNTGRLVADWGVVSLPKHSGASN